MNFTGNPGTGKTTVALRMAEILHRLGYVREGHLVSVTRDDLVGQYVGHTAPKTREVIKRAMGGVLFIDEAYYLYKPENERDYGQEAIEILLQCMENNRDDLVVILAGYKKKMDRFFDSNPGMRSRIAHHSIFPDYSPAELKSIAEIMLADQNYRLSEPAAAALEEYIPLRMRLPHFSNARSIRNALDRARLRQANRLFAARSEKLTRLDLITIEEPDIRGSRVFVEGKLDGDAATGYADEVTSSPYLGIVEARLGNSGWTKQGRTTNDSQNHHRPLGPVGGFLEARRRGRGGRGGRRRLDPSRRDGRPFRAQHHLRPAGHQGDPQPHRQGVRLPSDDRAGRPLSGRLRRRRLRHHHRACRGRAASRSLAAGDQERSARRPASRSTRRRQKTSSNMCSTGSISCS